MNKRIIALTIFCLLGVGTQAWGMEYFKCKYGLQEGDAKSLIKLFDSKDGKVWLNSQREHFDERVQDLVDGYKQSSIETPHGVKLGRYTWDEILRLKNTEEFAMPEEKQQSIETAKAKILKEVLRSETYYGHVDSITNVVEQEGVDFYSKNFEDGPLYYMCENYDKADYSRERGSYGMKAIIKYLVLQKKLDINMPVGPDKMPPLVVACTCQSTDLAKLFVEECRARITPTIIAHISRQGFYKTAGVEYVQGRYARSELPKQILLNNVLPFVRKVPGRLFVVLKNKKSKKDCIIKTVYDRTPKNDSDNDNSTEFSLQTIGEKRKLEIGEGDESIQTEPLKKCRKES